MHKLLSLSLISIVVILFVLNKRDEKVMAIIGRDKLYQSQIDSMIFDEIEKLRGNALEVKISRLLFEQEARKRMVTVEKLRQIEVFNKSKEISQSDIEFFANSNKISMTDSSNYGYIRGQLILINRRFRFEVFIDSLKKISGTKIIYEFSNSVKSNINKLYSHTLGNKNSRINFYIIADYNCASCKETYNDVFNVCSKFLDKIQLHFIYYSNNISEKAILGEAISNQGKFWEVNSFLFTLEEVNDSIIDSIAAHYQLDSKQIKYDFKVNFNKKLLLENQRLIEDLKIYSVPTFIIDDHILSGYYDTDKLVQILNYKILNN